MTPCFKAAFNCITPLYTTLGAFTSSKIKIFTFQIMAHPQWWMKSSFKLHSTFKQSYPFYFRSFHTCTYICGINLSRTKKIIIGIKPHTNEGVSFHAINGTLCNRLLHKQSFSSFPQFSIFSSHQTYNKDCNLS